MRGVRLRAYAKVNYALDVVGVREDGYHAIRTLMQNVSLADEVEIRRAQKGFGLRVEPEGTEIGPSESNTAYRAWSLVCDRVGERLPARISLRKNIPAGAGLGGGSADGAAVVRGLDELFGLGLSTGEMREIGRQVGADVPFFFPGGTALGEGIGEILTPAEPPPDHRLLLVKPPAGANTAEVYRLHDADPASGNATDRVLGALRSGDLEQLSASLGNDLAPVTRVLVPEVAELEEGLLRAGALGASMSGSGTAVFGLFRDEEEAARARKEVRASFASICAPFCSGVERI